MKPSDPRPRAKRRTFPNTRHPTHVRSAAVAIAAEGGLSMAEVSRRLERQKGVKVAPGTIRTWVAAADLSTDGQSVGKLARKALGLASSELARLERQSPSKRDLGRLAQTVSILKTIDPLLKSKSGQSGQTLTDLTGADESSASENESHLRAERSSADLTVLAGG